MSRTVVAMLVETSIRSTGIALVVATLLAVWRARSGAVRHAAWTAVGGSMLLMPLLVAMLPPVAVPIPRALSPLVLDPVEPLPRARVEPIAADIEQPASSRSTQAATSAASATPSTSFDGWTVLAIAYGLGVLCAGLRIAVGWRGAARIAADSKPVDVFCGRRIVKESGAVVVPVTVGVFAPIVLLPLAWRTWTDDERRAVLAHELAHISRRDPLATFIARVNRALFWFHPLAWWLERAVTAHAEYAADEATLQLDVDRRGYADLLLHFAQITRERNGRLTASVVGMASRPVLGRRIERVLHAAPAASPSRSHNRLVAAGCAIVILIGAACRFDSRTVRLATDDWTERRDRALRSDLARARRIEVGDLMQLDWDNRPLRIAELEAALANNPDDLESLKQLLITYWVAPDVRARRARILDLIARNPNADLAGAVEARLFPTALEPPFPGDPTGYAQAKELWLAHTKRPDVTPQILANAAGFFEAADQPLAEELLLRARALDPEGPWTAHLGRFYAATLTGSLAPSPAHHSRWVIAAGSARSGYAAGVRRKLGESSDDALLTAAGWSFARAIRYPGMEFDPQLWAESCFTRAIQVNPHAVLAHSALLRVRRQIDFSREVNALWTAPPDHQYESVSALADRHRFEQLPHLARDAYQTFRTLGRWDDRNLDARRQLALRNARQYADDALALAGRLGDDSNRGTAIYMANMTLGALALQSGDRDAAVSFLLKASEAPASEEIVYSDELTPDLYWHVVSDLLEQGERDAVATFLERLARVNIPLRVELRTAAAAVRRGEKPRL